LPTDVKQTEVPGGRRNWRWQGDAQRLQFRKGEKT